MKAFLTSYSENHSAYAHDRINFDASFICPLKGMARVVVHFENLSVSDSLGYIKDDDEFDIEIKVTRKPKQQSETIHFK